MQSNPKGTEPQQKDAVGSVVPRGLQAQQGKRARRRESWTSHRKRPPLGICFLQANQSRKQEGGVFEKNVFFVDRHGTSSPRKDLGKPLLSGAPLGIHGKLVMWSRGRAHLSELPQTWIFDNVERLSQGCEVPAFPRSGFSCSQQTTLRRGQGSDNSFPVLPAEPKGFCAPLNGCGFWNTWFPAIPNLRFVAFCLRFLLAQWVWFPLNPLNVLHFWQI